jgi:hypothetical protein
MFADSPHDAAGVTAGCQWAVSTVAEGQAQAHTG